MNKMTGGCLVLLGVALLAAIPLMWWLLYALWNWLVPDVFHGPTITYWQAAGLSILLGMVGGAFRSVVSVNR